MAITSLIDQLAEVAADLIKDARKEAKPMLKEGKRIAAAQAKAHAKLAKAEAEAKAEARADKAKAPKKKKHRLRKLLLLATIGGLVVLAAKKLTADEPGWQPTGTEPEPPAPAGKHAVAAPVTAEHEADDAAGATPDEALADADEHPHAVTTPETPLEVVQLVEPADEAVETPPAPTATKPTTTAKKAPTARAAKETGDTGA